MFLMPLNNRTDSFCVYDVWIAFVAHFVDDFFFGCGNWEMKGDGN